MEVLKLKTEQPGIVLRQVTELEDRAWFLTHRNFTHPESPENMGAPDYAAYQKQRRMWDSCPENQLSMGIWDSGNHFGGLIFAGYVTIKPSEIPGHTNDGEVGVQIASQVQGNGYATLGLSALMKYSCQRYGYEHFVADVLAANKPSRNLFTKLGFDECPSPKKGHLTFTKCSGKIDIES